MTTGTTGTTGATGTTGTGGTTGHTSPAGHTPPAGHISPGARIEKPTPFAQWIQTKRLFDDGATKTETYVTDGHEEGTRYAYGKSSNGWCFYIVMTPAEELVFLQAYLEWRKHRPSEHHHAAVTNATKPKDCGTPNTPPCEAITAAASIPGESPNTRDGVKAA